jgi:hypothetical protein
MRLPAAFTLCLLLASCSDSPLEPVEECPENQVSVTASPGVTPTFTWAPACGIASLNVLPTAGGPSPSPLISGTEYTILVYRYLSEGSGGPGAPLSAGSATFRP